MKLFKGIIEKELFGKMVQKLKHFFGFGAKQESSGSRDFNSEFEPAAGGRLEGAETGGKIEAGNKIVALNTEEKTIPDKKENVASGNFEQKQVKAPDSRPAVKKTGKPVQAVKKLRKSLKNAKPRQKTGKAKGRKKTGPAAFEGANIQESESDNKPPRKVLQPIIVKIVHEAKWEKRRGKRAKGKNTMDVFIRKRLGSQVEESKTVEIEKVLNEVMEKFNVSEKEIEKRLSSARTEQQLSEAISRLSDLLESERSSKQRLPEIKAERILTVMPAKALEMHKSKEAAGVSTEIVKRQIVTDFDRVLEFVSEKGQAKIGEISLALSLSKNRVEECCNLLKKEKQVEVVYHAFGDSVVISMQRLASEKAGKNRQ